MDVFLKNPPMNVRLGSFSLAHTGPVVFSAPTFIVLNLSIIKRLPFLLTRSCP